MSATSARRLMQEAEIPPHNPDAERELATTTSGIVKPREDRW